jgi:iron complex outermembrane receptor protein
MHALAYTHNYILMKRAILLSSLGIFSLGLTAQTSMTADTTSVNAAEITSLPGVVTPAKAPRSISIVDAEEIKNTRPASITDALELVTGVDVRQRGPMGIQTDFSVRGGTFNQTALIIDGVRWSAPQTGHHLFDIPLDPEDISKIEVVRGGFSPITGTGAMAGAVNIITSPGSENKTSVSVERGSFDWLRYKGTADFGTDKIRHRISYSTASTSGYSDDILNFNPDSLGVNQNSLTYTNNDASSTRFSYLGAADTKAGLVKVRLSSVEKAFGAQNYYTSDFPMQYEETSVLQGQVSLTNSFETGLGNLDLFVAACQRRHTDHFELYRVGEGFYNLNEDGVYEMGSDSVVSLQNWNVINDNISRTTGATASASLLSGAGLTTIYGDIREEALASGNLGLDSIYVFEDSTFYTKGERRITKDLSLMHNVNWGRFSATGSLGITHRDEDFGVFLMPGANFAMALDADENYILFGSANRSLRRPTFTNYYYGAHLAIGNLDLEPEWADNFEVGARLNFSNEFFESIVVEAAVFQRQGHNLIDWIRFDDPNLCDTITSAELDGAIYEYGSTYATNISERSFTGIELGLQLQDRHGRMIGVSYTQMESTADELEYVSVYSNDFLLNSLSAQVQMTLPFDVNLNIRFSHQQRNRMEEDVLIDPVSLLNINVNRTFMDKYNAYVGVNNLLDSDYSDIGNVQQPGRWIKAGLNFAF